MNVRFYFLLSCALCLFFSASLLANDRKFSYTYESSVLPYGAREIEVWNTYRLNRGFFYRRFDQRIEYEFGLGGNLMSSLYLNSTWKLQDSNGPDPGGDGVSSVSPSISSEWKYKLLDRVADPLGLALYSEATLGLDETEIEFKLIADKQLGNVLIAFNAVGEQEWETELESGVSSTASEIHSELNLGIAYQISHRFAVGIEIRNHNIIVDRVWKESALFAGPVVSYTEDSWWATLTVLPQVAGLRGAKQDNLVLGDHEKLEMRLLFSFHI